MNAEITKLTERFTADLAALLRSQALESIGAALTGSAPKLKSATFRRVPPPARAPGQKRSADEIERLTVDLRTHIANHPGQRIEQIGKAMGVPTKDLALPVRKLVGAALVRTKGQKRATTYYSR